MLSAYGQPQHGQPVRDFRRAAAEPEGGYRGTCRVTAETEADTRANRIDPVLREAGWGVVEGSQGASRADLSRPHHRRGRAGQSAVGRLRADLSRPQAGGDRGQARRARPYATASARPRIMPTRLQARFAYATNGLGWYGIDMQTGAEGDHRPAVSDAARSCGSAASPRARLARPLRRGAVRDRWRQVAAALLPAQRDHRRAGGHRQGRAAHPADAGDRHRQDLHRLPDRLEAVPGQWNLSREPVRRPRILFLADRNILADQAYNAFSAFPPDALCRISPDEIRKQRRHAEERQRVLHHLPDLHDRRRATDEPSSPSRAIRRISSTSS